MSNACSARRASAAQSTPDPFPIDEVAGGDELGVEADPSTGGETVIAVSQLKRLGAASSERTFGRITGGKNSSSTERRTGEAGTLRVRDVITSAAIKAIWSVSTTTNATYREGPHPFDSAIV
jgi:hypothetical protein